MALLALGFVLTSHAISLLLASFELRDTGTLGEIDRVVAATRGPSRLLAVAALGIAPAFGEELLFRGLVQQAALRRLGAALAVVLSAACFGADPPGSRPVAPRPSPSASTSAPRSSSAAASGSQSCVTP